MHGVDYVVHEDQISLVHSASRTMSEAPIHRRGEAQLIAGGPLMSPAEAEALLAPSSRSATIPTSTTLKVPPDRPYLFYHSRGNEHSSKRPRGGDGSMITLTVGGPKTGTIYWSDSDPARGVLRTACTQKSAPAIEAVKFLLVRRHDQKLLDWNNGHWGDEEPAQGETPLGRCAWQTYAGSQTLRMRSRTRTELPPGHFGSSSPRRVCPCPMVAETCLMLTYSVLSSNSNKRRRAVACVVSTGQAWRACI